jgi:hypothetical protein
MGTVLIIDDEEILYDIMCEPLFPSIYPNSLGLSLPVSVLNEKSKGGGRYERYALIWTATTIQGISAKGR